MVLIELCVRGCEVEYIESVDIASEFGLLSFRTTRYSELGVLIFVANKFCFVFRSFSLWYQQLES